MAKGPKAPELAHGSSSKADSSKPHWLFDPMEMTWKSTWKSVCKTLC